MMSVALDFVPMGFRESFDGDLEGAMRRFIREGADDVPLPGGGRTIERWRVLAEIAGLDLALAKIFESHADAKAIRAELGHEADRFGIQAVWAAESPRDPLVFDGKKECLTGVKSWCSGASFVNEGLVTARTAAGASVLVSVPMKQAGVHVGARTWTAGGMVAADTRTVRFEGVRAMQVGPENAYLERPGFWHGGAGIAALWYGAAVEICEFLGRSSRISRDAHARAHLGATWSALRAARSLLRETAAWIDAHPESDAQTEARALRAVVEEASAAAIRRSGRALGAAPLCDDREHARRVADLEIFLRQSHAERDLDDLGARVAGEGQPWSL